MFISETGFAAESGEQFVSSMSSISNIIICSVSVDIFAVDATVVGLDAMVY